VYEEFFDLSIRPFSTVPDAEAFVPVLPAQEALDALLHCLSQGRGIGVVTSPAGLGKTILCKRLASLLANDARPVFLSTSAFNTRRALMQSVLYELGISYMGLSEQEARLKLFETARETEQAGRYLLLIVDEAHLLPNRLFEELRTLTDYAPDGHALIRLLLSGQFELEEKLADPALSAVNQRIGCQVCLEPLSWEQSARLIVERLRQAGGADVSTLITDEALETICRASDGNPRCLCQLTDHSLLLAFAEEQRPVDQQVVLAALEDLKELPLHWNELYLESATFDHDDETGPAPETLEQEDDFVPEPSAEPELHDTAEFEIPDFLRKPAPSAEEPVEEPPPSQAGDTYEIESTGEVHEPPPPREPVEEEVEYAVIEVGRDVGPETSPGSDSSGGSASPVETEPETVIEATVEIPVIDRYAMLDRLAEQPDAPAPSPAMHPAGGSDIQPTGESPGQPEMEETLLEDVEEIRRDIAETVDRSRSPVPLLPAEPESTLEYDIVEPEPHGVHSELPPQHSDPGGTTAPNQLPEPAPPLEPASGDEEAGWVETHRDRGSIPNDPPIRCVATHPAPPESGSERFSFDHEADAATPDEPSDSRPTRRFEQLFTRLRSRRQKVQSERNTP
jgi:type II secretory pathway predicted ATPase ExeA